MNCSVCNFEMKKTISTDDAPYHYKECGLPGVYLVGIEVFSCDKCKEVSVAIPKIAQLHSLIVEDLLDKPSVLTYKEARFLRKQFGIPANQWAPKVLSVTPEHLSRSENADSLLTPSMDKIVRLYTTILKNDDEGKLKEILFSENDHHQKTSRKKLQFEAKFILDANQEWQLAA